LGVDGFKKGSWNVQRLQLICVSSDKFIHRITSALLCFLMLLLLLVAEMCLYNNVDGEGLGTE
jgi:hypothetical protein